MESSQLPHHSTEKIAIWQEKHGTHKFPNRLPKRQILHDQLKYIFHLKQMTPASEKEYTLYTALSPIEARQMEATTGPRSKTTANGTTLMTPT